MKKILVFILLSSVLAAGYFFTYDQIPNPHLPCHRKQSA
jgi:hypothetical protein